MCRSKNIPLLASNTLLFRLANDSLVTEYDSRYGVDRYTLYLLRIQYSITDGNFVLRTLIFREQSGTGYNLDGYWYWYSTGTVVPAAGTEYGVFYRRVLPL